LLLSNFKLSFTNKLQKAKQTFGFLY